MPLLSFGDFSISFIATSIEHYTIDKILEKLSMNDTWKFEYNNENDISFVGDEVSFSIERKCETITIIYDLPYHISTITFKTEWKDEYTQKFIDFFENLDKD